MRRRPATDVHHQGVRHRADVLVTTDGRSPIDPLLAIMRRDFAIGAATAWSCHSDIDIVCVMLAGRLLFEPLHGDPLVFGAEDVAVVSTGSRLDYRWQTIGDEPAHAVMFWLRASGGRPEARFRPVRRAERIAEITAIAGTGTAIPTSAAVTIRACVLPINTCILHDFGERHGYLLSTLGQIRVDNVRARGGDGVLAYGMRAIQAVESTEVVVVERNG